jgi:hypothetical protein
MLPHPPPNSVHPLAGFGEGMHCYVPNQFAQFAPHTMFAAAVPAEQMIKRSMAVDARALMTFGILLCRIGPA